MKLVSSTAVPTISCWFGTHLRKSLLSMLDLLLRVTTVLTVVLTASPDPITFIWVTILSATRHISSVLASVKLDSRSSPRVPYHP